MTTHAESGSVRIDTRKYPDHLHWQFSAQVLGEDEYGLWVHVPSDTMARRGSEPVRPIGTGFVSLVPVDDPWIVEFYLSHPWHTIYVNIGTVPSVIGDRIHQIDLDLDVVLTVDGDVKILDEDEFVEHQVLYGYPEEVRDAALVATERARKLLVSRSAPFNGAADRWLQIVDPETLS
ncbi:MAG: DUF402 domain-containing protein [Actinomycetota bacterium]